MTKEEIEHNHIKEIAEKYIQESWGSYLDLDEVDLVLAGIGVAKIISKEKDERIGELEAQIEKMRNFQNCDYQLHIIDCPIFKSGGHISCKKCPHWILQEASEWQMKKWQKEKEKNVSFAKTVI